MALTLDYKHINTLTMLPESPNGYLANEKLCCNINQQFPKVHFWGPQQHNVEYPEMLTS